MANFQIKIFSQKCFKFLLSILPKVIRRFIISQFKVDIIEEYKRNLQNFRSEQIGIPGINLNQIHIKNLRILENREKLLELLPKNAIVAELGVDTGDFSRLIIKKTNPKKIHLIDAWGSNRYNNSKKEAVLKRFEREIDNNLLEVNLGYSTQVLKLFKDNYFDWIYIDTDHSYNTTKSELEIAAEKVKNTGIICGHDYFMGNWVSGYKYGVIEAVHEFCVNHNWEILYLTIEQSIPPSFALRKIELT